MAVFTLIAGALLLGSLTSGGAALAPPEVVNETSQAPYLKPSRGPLLFSDSPEDLRSPGLTDAAVLGGRLRLFDYHVNLTRRSLWVGAIVRNPHPHPVALTVTDSVAATLGSLGAERRFVIRWLTRRAHPSPVRYLLMPGAAISFLRRIPPGAVSALVMDLATGARDWRARLEVRMVAVRHRRSAAGPLPLLPRQVGLIRAVFPHSQVTGRWAPGPLGRPLALDLGEVSGPDVGYAAESNTLPGEAQEGSDALDYGTSRPTVWQKGGYAMIEAVRIRAGSSRHPVALAVVHPGLNVVAVDRPGSGTLHLLGHTPLRLDGRPVTVITTVLPGGNAPIRLVLRPIGAPDPGPHAGWALVHYGYAYGDPGAPYTIRIRIPPVAWTSGTVRLAPAIGGVGAALRPGLGIEARGPGRQLRDWVARSAARHLVTMTVPFPVRQLYFKSTAPASYWLDWRGRKTLLVFRDNPPSPAWMGPDGGSVMAGGVAAWLPAGALRRAARIRVRVAATLPRLPQGLGALTPVIQVAGPRGVRLRHPLVLDLDNLAAVDHAADAGQRLVLLGDRGGHFTPLRTGNGATWLAGGNERSYPVAGFGRYVMAERTAPRP